MRLISLCPSITQLVFDLGCGSHLVGITQFCIHPASAVAVIEKVGGTKNPKIQRILELKPDLVLLNQEENRREDWDMLDQAGIPCLVTFPESVDGAIHAVHEIGRAIGALEAAGEIAASIEQAFARVSADAQRFAGVRWAYLIWRKPWMGAGSGTYIHGLISAVGGQNVCASLEGSYPTLTLEVLANAKPDCVFLSSEPFRFREKHRHELAQATGLPLERFVLVDGEVLSWHGSQTAKGLEYAHQLLAEVCSREQWGRSGRA